MARVGLARIGGAEHRRHATRRMERGSTGSFVTIIHGREICGRRLRLKSPGEKPADRPRVMSGTTSNRFTGEKGRRSQALYVYLYWDGRAIAPPSRETGGERNMSESRAAGFSAFVLPVAPVPHRGHARGGRANRSGSNPVRISAEQRDPLRSGTCGRNLRSRAPFPFKLVREPASCAPPAIFLALALPMALHLPATAQVRGRPMAASHRQHHGTPRQPTGAVVTNPAATPPPA